jgi:hypothetical protein
MKNLIKFILVVIMGLALLTACQEERIEIKLPPPGTTITSANAAAGLITSVSKRDGSSDNILDKSSCTAVVFPVTIKTNGQTITVKSSDDLDEIEHLFDDSGDDDVEFIFPIKVILADHTEVTVNNETEFKAILDNCSQDDDIECIDFKYPIEFNTYDANNQVAGSITIEDDEALFNFIKALKKDELVGLKFPVTLVKSDGTELVISDFEELEDAIEDAKDDCDEDDDNDFNDDDVSDANFSAVLIDGTWQVDSFIDDGSNRTTQLSGYLFTFKSDKSMEAVKSTTTIPGVWATDGDSGEIELLISLSGNDPFDDISEDWTVTEFTTTTIHLEKGDGDDKRILVFKKA